MDTYSIETFGHLSEQVGKLSEQLSQLPEQLSQLSQQSTQVSKTINETEQLEEVRRRDKEVFLGLATTLSAISTFTGAFNLNAYFNLKCPFSLTAVYLHSSSLLLLSAPIGLLMVHLLLSALPKNYNVPGKLLHAVMLQFQVAGLMLALAILYISLAFYFYTDPSNPRFLGIGGIIMVASVINVPLVYGLVGTWNIIFISLPKRAPNDGEPPTFRAWIREKYQKLTYSEYRRRLIECWSSCWEIVESCKSGEFTKAIATYWNIISTPSLFRPVWKRLHRYIFAFILLEFSAFFVFFALALVEMVKAPMKCS